MPATSRASSKRKSGIVEPSDADPFTVAPFVDKFCLEFQKFHQETSRQIHDSAISSNGHALVENIRQELNKIHQDASHHATVAVYNGKAVMDKLHTDLGFINSEATTHTQGHSKVMVDNVQAEFHKIQGHASNMAVKLSTIMSNNPCLALHPQSQWCTFEMDVDDSSDPTETGGESEQVQAELERLKVQVTTITLTTKAAKKLYATKSFLDGDYAENPYLWKVNFDSEWIEPQPLAELQHIEIHIGGNFFAKINHENSEGFVEDNKPGEVALCIDDLVWVTLSLSGYKASDMESLKAIASNMVLYALLYATSTRIHFRVLDIQFFSPSIPGLMSFVTMDQEREQNLLDARDSAILEGLLEVGDAHSVETVGTGHSSATYDVSPKRWRARVV